MAFNWTCPYCSRPQSVVGNKVHDQTVHFSLETPAEGDLALYTKAICCSNPDCQKTTISVFLIPCSTKGTHRVYGQQILSRRIVPESKGRPQPDCIPAALREDYYEACLILDLSPKASATLARRCLQGMIRDFCGIARGALAEEIKALKALVETGNAPLGVSMDSVEAIDHVRGIGNIGAHMEKDINLIVPVEPHEAQLLLELIESLFEEWYVEREKRAQRFASVKALAESKKAKLAEQKQLKLEGPNQPK